VFLDRPKLPTCLSLCLFAAGAALGICAGKAVADEPVIPADAIAVLTGGTEAGESDATPLLFSDIEFEAFLTLTGKEGPSGLLETLTKEDWRQAKERAAIIRLLADQARRLHETAAKKDKEALRAEILRRAGGEAALSRFLARIGMKRDAVDRWIENAALALTQIRFIKEQAAVSSQDIAASEPRKKTPGGPSSAPRAATSRGSDLEALRKKLIESLQGNRIRVLR
jgi:hypothetical protein